MKKIMMIALAATLIAGSAFAYNDHDTRRAEREQARDHRDAAQLAAAKSHISHQLNSRIGQLQHKMSCLQAAQSCVNGASDQRSLNRCRTECGG